MLRLVMQHSATDGLWPLRPGGTFHFFFPYHDGRPKLNININDYNFNFNLSDRERLGLDNNFQYIAGTTASSSSDRFRFKGSHTP